MKGFLKDIIFVLVMGMFGVAGGVGIMSILSVIAAPNYMDMLLTVKEKADLEAMSTGFLAVLGGNVGVMAAVMVIIAIIGFIFVLYELNPNFGLLRRHTVKMAKAAVAAAGGAVLFLLLVAAMARMPLAIISGILPSSLPEALIFYGVVLCVISGMLWVLVGETGWAGDLVSWRAGSKDMVMPRWPKFLTSFLMGAACGGIAYCLLLLLNESFNKYFLLVAEVLGRSGEPSIHGWRLLSYSLMVMLGFSLAIIAGFVTVLSAREMTVRARLIRLIVPAVLLAVYAVIICGTYRDAVTRYDLNKKNLAEAAGIPEKGQAVRTVLLFIPEKTAVKEWRMEAAGSGVMVSNNTYALTPENITKIENYLSSRKDGSIFFYAGQDAVMKGYFKLWETEKAVERMFVNANSQILARMVLLKRLSSIPATAENEKYLRSFADETKWYSGKTPSLRIAEAFMHFGRADEAKAWADKAKAKGADPAKSAFLSGPVLTGTSVAGAVNLNGAPLTGRKVALFSYRPKMTNIDPQSFASFPVDAKTTDGAGRFAFTNLGKGEYVLAVMVDNEQVSSKVPADGLSVENAPGIIRIDAENPSRSLGTIAIKVK